MRLYVKRVIYSVVMLMAVVFFFGTVYAATLEEAKTLGEKAAAYVKANGKEKGAAEIGLVTFKVVFANWPGSFSDVCDMTLILCIHWVSLKHGTA
jgi:hypothetical protein